MDYKTQLSQWKVRHGLVPEADCNQDELAMAAEEASSKEESWCVFCDIQMPISQMKLITRRIDPYIQIDESEGDFIANDNRVRVCPECFAERYSSHD